MENYTRQALPDRFLKFTGKRILDLSITKHNLFQIADLSLNPIKIQASHVGNLPTLPLNQESTDILLSTHPFYGSNPKRCHFFRHILSLDNSVAQILQNAYVSDKDDFRLFTRNGRNILKCKDFNNHVWYIESTEDSKPLLFLEKREDFYKSVSLNAKISISDFLLPFLEGEKIGELSRRLGLIGRFLVRCCAEFYVQGYKFKWWIPHCFNYTREKYRDENPIYLGKYEPSGAYNREMSRIKDGIYPDDMIVGASYHMENIDISPNNIPFIGKNYSNYFGKPIQFRLLDIAYLMQHKILFLPRS